MKNFDYKSQNPPLSTLKPDNGQYVLFAQHGWADTHRSMQSLANSLAPPGTPIVTPNLGYLRTWLRMDPLVDQVEAQAIATRTQYPRTPWRIIGHSMGGLIWVEVLTRHPEWWPGVESLVLVACPVGGADLARIIDPWGWGIGIARDLGYNRRDRAEAIAAHIPTLVLAGNIDGGGDGTITVGSTRVGPATTEELAGLSHPALRCHPQVTAAIQAFWEQPISPHTCEPDFATLLIAQLQATEGMIDAHPRDFKKAQIWLRFANGITLRTWQNWCGVDHVFLASPTGQCLYGGFVGWQHRLALRSKLALLQQDYA